MSSEVDDCTTHRTPGHDPCGDRLVEERRDLAEEHAGMQGRDLPSVEHDAFAVEDHEEARVLDSLVQNPCALAEACFLHGRRQRAEASAGRSLKSARRPRLSASGGASRH